MLRGVLTTTAWATTTTTAESTSSTGRASAEHFVVDWCIRICSEPVRVVSFGAEKGDVLEQ